MKRFVVTGATGFIGQLVVRKLRGRGDAVSVIGRDAARIRQTFGDAVSPLAWDDANGWKSAVQDADAVIHLAGEPINGQRWSPEFKQKVLSSRVETTRAIADAQPSVFVSASAVGYYGDCKNETITETDRRGSDFLADVCAAWEQEAVRARNATGNSRVAIVRIGIVLGRDGGPLQSMLQPPGAPFSPFKLGLGGPLGSGKQWVPWIHVEDVASMLLFAADNPGVPDVMNGVAPEPITNAQLTAAIGRALNRPAVVPVPSFALYALLGEFAYALLYSQRVLPAAAQATGFVWKFPDIETALRDLLAAT